MKDFTENEKIAFEAMIQAGFDFDETVEKIENEEYRIYLDCYNMTDVAYQVVEETEILENIPEVVALHFDYESYGITLDSEGHYVFVGSNAVEILYYRESMRVVTRATASEGSAA